MTIYHIAFRADWSAASESSVSSESSAASAASAAPAGEYRVSTRGRTLEQEGFIHASTPSQVAAVADAFYADVDTEDLVILVIDPERLTAELKYDLLSGAAEPFPHIYGPLNADAVVGTAELKRDRHGHCVFEG